jgi:hypothetical protein
MSDEIDKEANAITQSLLDAVLDRYMRDPYYRALRKQREEKGMRERLRLVSSREEHTP